MYRLTLGLVLLSFLALTSAAKNPIFLNESLHTGYVNLKDRGDMFYWLFESRRSPSKDPLVLYYTGEEDQSSAFPILSVNGPYRINHDNTTLRTNPYSWNNIANMLYIDAPLGSGFSNAYSQSAIPITIDNIANDIVYVLQQFLNQHPEYKGRDLFVTGIGYEAPLLAATCLKLLQKSSSVDLNVKGWYVGGPLIYFAQQAPLTWADYAYQHKLINKTFYQNISKTFTNDTHWIESNLDDEDELLEASDDIWEHYSDLISAFPTRNPLNIALPCYQNSTTVVCYDLNNIIQFMNRSEVRKALNVTADTWTFSNTTPYANSTDREFYKSNIPLYNSLLQTGLPGIISCGMNDLTWNCPGVEDVIIDFKWSAQKKFNQASYKTWKNYGEYKHYDNFTFIKINNSGFFTAMDGDAPLTSLLIFDRLLKNKGW